MIPVVEQSFEVLINRIFVLVNESTHTVAVGNLMGRC